MLTVSSVLHVITITSEALDASKLSLIHHHRPCAPSAPPFPRPLTSLHQDPFQSSDATVVARRRARDDRDLSSRARLGIQSLAQVARPTSSISSLSGDDQLETTETCRHDQTSIMTELRASAARISDEINGAYTGVGRKAADVPTRSERHRIAPDASGRNTITTGASHMALYGLGNLRCLS